MEIITLRFIQAAPGEHIEQAASRARMVGVSFFLHNDRIFCVSVTDYEEVGSLSRKAISGIGEWAW